MAIEDVAALKARLQRDVRTFANGGTTIIERTAPFADATSLRTAANQFRQAAQALDQLDAIEQVLFHLKSR